MFQPFFMCICSHDRDSDLVEAESLPGVGACIASTPTAVPATTGQP